MHVQRWIIARLGTAPFIAAAPDDSPHMPVAISLWDAIGYQRELPARCLPAWAKTAPQPMAYIWAVCFWHSA
jgi:hypothetical protein